MCLAVIAVNVLPKWPLIIVANRDEFHERPTASLAPWPDKGNRILGGRDLRASGTWLGVNLKGHIGLLTNYREPGKNDPNALSRGNLIEHYLSESVQAHQYIQDTQTGFHEYNGFNLVLSDDRNVCFTSNRSSLTGASSLSDPLAPGVYGLSNASLDTPWPKLVWTRDAVRNHIMSHNEPASNVLFEIFSDRRQAGETDMPKTGLSPDRERLLSSPFIVDPLYGTRSTSIIFKHRYGKIYFFERSFDPLGNISDDQSWLFNPEFGSFQYNSTGQITND